MDTTTITRGLTQYYYVMQHKYHIFGVYICVFVKKIVSLRTFILREKD